MEGAVKPGIFSLECNLKLSNYFSHQKHVLEYFMYYFGSRSSW